MEECSQHSPSVVIAGAGGFVGKALIDHLKKHHQVIALSRRPQKPLPNVLWRSCDLFSLLQTEKTLDGADVGIYLVHSMLPSPLTQASFQDMDLILADNFGRAAYKKGLKHIIYLGGLVPDSGERLSEHLESRLEVEHALGHYGVPVTSLRAAMIIGAGGSSFQIMQRLVTHLPIMLCPKWTQSKTQPISLDDVIKLIKYCIDQPPDHNQSFDIGGKEVMTYTDMMQQTADLLKKKRLIIPIPLLTTKLSILWVRLFSGAHKELITPLVESLRHDMIVTDGLLHQKTQFQRTPFKKAVEDTLRAEREKNEESVKQELLSLNWSLAQKKSVCSIQRMPLPIGHDAFWVAEEYARWLPIFFKVFIRVKVDAEKNLAFYISGLPWALLELNFSAERSTTDRALYYISGGFLSHKSKEDDNYPPGRLEFRTTPDGKSAMAAIFNFRPSLPWFFYRLTQAPAHLFVMKCFSNHLSKK